MGKIFSVKRQIRSGKYYNVARDKKGKIVSFKPYRPQKTAIEKAKATKLKKLSPEQRKELIENRIRKQKFTKTQGFAKNLKKQQTTITRITKANLIERIPRTNVIELELKSPLKGKKGLLQIVFLFRKEREKVMVTARSNKLSFPSQFVRGFNQCIRRAFGQINFSPDEMKVQRLSYIYWINK